jgi:hypothetical protein
MSKGVNLRWYKTKINTRISQLPQVLQDHIYSYNPEHRRLMKLVCEEITPWIECANMCGTMLPKYDTEYTETLIGNELIYCSLWCKSNDYYNCRDILRSIRRQGI